MYTIDENLLDLGKKVINENPEFEMLRDGEVNIMFLRCDKPKGNKNRITYADCEKLNDKHATLAGCQFVITFYADSERMDEKQLEILMFHELLHVGWDGEKAFIVPHDCEDFKCIIEKYGTDWNVPKR